MTINLEARILGVLSAQGTETRTTIADFARMFGASRELVVSCTQRMVEDGSAVGRYVDRRGTPTLQALSRQPDVRPTLTSAAPAAVLPSAEIDVART